MQALTIFAGPVCLTLSQRDESFIWLFLLLVIWPLAVGILYVIYRLVSHFIKMNKKPRSKLNHTLKMVALSAYGLTVLLIIISILTASKKIIDGGYNNCGVVVSNELSNFFITLSLAVFWVHVFLLVAYLLEPFVNKNKKYK